MSMRKPWVRVHIWGKSEGLPEGEKKHLCEYNGSGKTIWPGLKFYCIVHIEKKSYKYNSCGKIFSFTA